MPIIAWFVSLFQKSAIRSATGKSKSKRSQLSVEVLEDRMVLTGYTFATISDQVVFLGPAASINDSGTVAFAAVLDAGQLGVFTGDGGALTIVADNTSQFSGFLSPSINDQGAVAFKADLAAGGSGVFAVSNGNLITIAQTGTQFNQLASFASINNSGTVAFRAALTASGSGIFTGDGGALTTIADPSSGLSGFTIFPVINDAGTVAFNGSGALYTATNGVYTLIAEATGDPVRFESPVFSMNNNGEVAFEGEFTSGAHAVFVGNGSSVTAIVDTDGPYASFGNESINAGGSVVFQASTDAGGLGIFSGPDPVHNKIIATGDALNGSTVVTLSLGREGLNDNGQVAFYAELADGRHGIFRADPLPFSPSTLSGIVYVDFNNDGEVDFGENGIAGVTVALTGADDQGAPVSLSQATDADGTYLFADLRPGQYHITETQPANFAQGINTIGTAGGSLSAVDQFFLALPDGVDGMNYNFGERPLSGGSVQAGQTASIGFWNNKHGQSLIKSLNGGPASTQLADWLAATFPNMYGAAAGSNDLAGRTNSQVATFFQSLFTLKGPKLDAQVLGTALAVYSTNSTLAGNSAMAYGFVVTGYGVGASTFNVGSRGAAFDVVNNTSVAVMDLLLATDRKSVNGVLNYNANANTMKTQRDLANSLYSDLNQAGDIN